MRRFAAVVFLAGLVVAVDGGQGRTASPSERTPVLSRQPYMGVSCRVPNSIACDRVGLAVYLPKRRPAVRLTASINCRPVRMRVPAGVATRGIYFEGFLHDAGLDKGPLKVSGDEPVFALVGITAHYADGSSRSAIRTIGLAPGWG